MSASNASKVRKWKLACLAGAMFMLAGIVELLPGLIGFLRNSDSSHRVMQLTSLSSGAMFFAVGSLWLAIGAMWKRKAAS